MLTMIKNILTLIVLICVSMLPTSIHTAPTKQTGPVVLVGGGSIPIEAINWFKSHSLNDNFVVITQCLERCVFWRQYLPNSQFVLAKDFTSIDGVGGIVICGGCQWEYLQTLNNNLLQQAHNQGIPILATSAGAMLFGEHYFSAKYDTITSEETLDIANEYKITLGKLFLSISYFTNTIIDTHYTERSREIRLRSFIRKSGAKRGIGIDEATAVCYNNTEQRVFGLGKVHLVE